MTLCSELLISVRNQEEFDAVLHSRVDVIDLKEPHNGPLAPADLAVLRHAADVFCRSKQQHGVLSAALGERTQALEVAAKIPAEFAYAKVGPSGCQTEESLLQLWGKVRAKLSPAIELVAVAYADHENAGSLDPMSVFAAASKAGLRRCLIDTYCKDGRTTLDHLGIAGLQEIMRLSREQRLWWAMAGSIREDQVRPIWAADVQPDCFGVRGDVCEGSRTDSISVDRVRSWQDTLMSVCQEVA
ncbi:MAG: (5-formylfuran-3-yl)methyl phosphate synthase [Rubripirellula sp.]